MYIAETRPLLSFRIEGEGLFRYDRVLRRPFGAQQNALPVATMSLIDLTAKLELTQDAVRDLFRGADFPADPIIVNLVHDGESYRLVDASTSAAVRLLPAAEKHVALDVPCTIMVRGAVVSEVNAGSTEPLLFLARATVVLAAPTKLMAYSPTQYRLPADRVPGGKAYEFFNSMMHFMNDRDLAGVGPEMQAEAATIDEFLRQHVAMETLHASPAHAASTTPYMTALEQFRAAQLDKQKASLTSNTGRANASSSTQISEQHEAALKQALLYNGPLTSEVLCGWHCTLCQGLNRHPAGALRPARVSVRVGHTAFQPSSVVGDHLAQLCQAVNSLESRLLHPRPHSSELSRGLAAMVYAAAVFFGVVDTHAFQDGNGRLARIAGNWALMKAGLPFCIHFSANPGQRTEYTSATVLTRRNLYLTRRGHVENEDLELAFAKAGALGPIVRLFTDRVHKAVVELKKAAGDNASHVDDDAEARAAKTFRERAAAGNCFICFDGQCNIATLCCGKAVHLNCMAEWLSSGNGCPQCRAELPSLPPRMRAPANSGENNDDAMIDATTSSNLEEAETTTDDTTADMNPEIVNQMVQNIMAAAAANNDTTSSSTDSTSMENAADATDDTTTDEDDDMTTVANGNQDHLPAFCIRGHCSNRSARDCSNQCCGRCCMLYGHYQCDRHSG